MKPILIRTGRALLLAGAGFVGGCIFLGSLRWTGAEYFVDANKQMIAIAVEGAEDRDPRQCLFLLDQYYASAEKHPWGLGYVHRNLVEFERAIWNLDPDPASAAGHSRR